MVLFAVVVTFVSVTAVKYRLGETQTVAAGTGNDDTSDDACSTFAANDMSQSDIVFATLRQ